MLQVKTSSWHYRLWKLGRDYSSQPRNLCQYFWHLALIKILIPATIVLLAICGVVALVWVIYDHPIETVKWVFAFAVAAAVLGSLLLLIMKLSEKREDRRLDPTYRSRPKKEPGLVRQFLKTRKRKMCPLIQVVDDRKIDVR